MRSISRPARIALLLAVLFSGLGSILSVAGCAPLQRVPLDVGPQRLTLHLDGEAIEPMPSEVELRADRDHALYFKSEGYLPELVVLRTTGAGSAARLEPASVRVRLAPRRVHVSREFEIAPEDEN